MPTLLNIVTAFSRRCRLLAAAWIFPIMAYAADPLPQQSASGKIPPPMTDIHDIKALADVGRDLPWVAILISLGILAVLLALFFYFRRLRKSIETRHAIVELPAEINAHRALDRIADVQQMDGKAFYFALSAILRQYLYERFKINAPEMTTEELLPQLESLDLAEDLYEGVTRLCRGSDPIKYANERPDERRMAGDLAFAREFVDGTTPKESDGTEAETPRERELTTQE